MIQQTAYGGRLIVSQRYPVRVKYSDPFPQHAYGNVAYQGVAEGGSGLFWYYWQFYLIDTLFYYYILDSFDYYGGELTSPMQTAFEAYKAAHAGGWAGEWWNAVGRNAVTDKVRADEAADWFLTH